MPVGVDSRGTAKSKGVNEPLERGYDWAFDI
jgi:hypothetical protein